MLCGVGKTPGLPKAIKLTGWISCPQTQWYSQRRGLPAYPRESVPLLLPVSQSTHSHRQESENQWVRPARVDTPQSSYLTSEFRSRLLLVDQPQKDFRLVWIGGSLNTRIAEAPLKGISRCFDILLKGKNFWLGAHPARRSVTNVMSSNTSTPPT